MSIKRNINKDYSKIHEVCKGISRLKNSFREEDRPRM